MNNIEKLIKKYNNNYTPGEQRSKEYNRKMKQKETLHNKKTIAEDLYQEIPFHITQNDKEQINHIIEMIPNFKKLHGTAETETIILAIIFYTKMTQNTRIDLDNYHEIAEKYQLTHKTYEIILCRLNLEYLKNIYIIPTKPKDKNHNILLKGKIK